MNNSIVSLSLIIAIILYAPQILPHLPGALYSQPIPVNSDLGTLKLLTDRAVQGFQNNSNVYSISQLHTGYDVLLKLAKSGEADKIPGGTNGVLFLLGDTIKLLTLNSTSAVRNVTVFLSKCIGGTGNTPSSSWQFAFKKQRYTERGIEAVCQWAVRH